MYGGGTDSARVIDVSFDQLNGDTVVTATRPAIICGLEFFSADNVVFGADYPFGRTPAGSDTRATIEGIAIDERTGEKLSAGNARHLFDF